MTSKSGESEYLYRIMPFKHVVDMFESREFYFASPTTWEDPYEQVLQHQRTAFIFAQCWCKRAVSDAMWRIYSADHGAVRIRTTRGKLESVCKRIQALHAANFCLEDVGYAPSKVVSAELSVIASELGKRFDLRRAIQALYLKRDAFDFEAEVRAVAILKPNDPAYKTGFLRVGVDPHHLVDSILFDPRADETYVKVATHYLRTVLKFDGSIARSVLYKASAIHIPNAEEEAKLVKAKIQLK